MTQPREAKVFIIDAVAEQAQLLAMALDGVGLPVEAATFGQKDLFARLERFAPSLLLVHAEPSSHELMTLLARVETLPSGAVPVVLLCKDVSDDAFVRPLKTGVVELLAEPWTPRLYTGRIRVLTQELPDRPGRVRGRGGPSELAGLVHHVMRMRRTGGVVVGEGTDDEGRAFFVRGVLKSARFRGKAMQTALAEMTRAPLPWAFEEGADGTSALVDFDAAAEAADPFVFQADTRPMAAFHDAQTRQVPQPVLPVPLVSAQLLPPSPFAPVPQPAPTSAQPPTPVPVPDADAARTPMLFVDDDPAVVHMLAGYFSKKGYPVSTAADGLEAMTLLGTHRFEVVLADLNMPRLDGWGLLRLVREDLRTQETPVALFSAQDDYRESLRLLHAGAQAYFPKTLRLAALEAQVRELLEPRRRFLRLLTAEGGLLQPVGSLGPQWVLRALSEARYTGELDARDSWSTWRAWFDRGRLVQMHSKVGPVGLSGDRSLTSFLSSRTSEGTLSPGARAPEEGFAGHPTESTLQRVVPWMNDEQRRAREDQLTRARSLQVNDELYRLYATVGPPAWLPIARLLCEQKLTPAQVMAQLQVTPIDVAAVVKDLLRRGVATVQA
jgi:DNA-binding response OmpR family regulator